MSRAGPALEQLLEPEAFHGNPALERSHTPVARHAPWWAPTLRILVMVISDCLTLIICGAFSYVFWAHAVRSQPADVYLQLLAFVPFFPLAYASVGLYPGFGLGPVQTLKRLSLRTTFTFLLLAATSFALRIPHHYARTWFVIALGLSLVMVPLTRWLINVACRHRRWWREPAIVYGIGPSLDRTLRTLDRSIWAGYRPDVVVRRSEPRDVSVDEPLRAVLDDARARGVRVALVTETAGMDATAVVHTLERWFRHVVLLRGSYSDHELAVEEAEVRNVGGMLGIEFPNQLSRLRNRSLKRLMDIVLGSLLVIATTPVIVAAMLAIRLTSRGSPIFRQEREGREGAPIQVLKLRTMYADAAERLDHHLGNDPDAAQEWQRRFKLKDDPRILPVIGALLRRWSLDELPQLWQVVRGEMSLVGPRPFPSYHLDAFDADFLALRRRVRPGLTGLWQVMVRSQGSLAEQEFFDTYYIRNWSLWMDIYVLAKTLTAVVSGRGAV